MSTTARLYGVEWDEMVINRAQSPSSFFILQMPEKENISNL
jgi:hypothetical protein